MRTQDNPMDKPHEDLEWWTEPTPLVSAHATLRLFRALVSSYLKRREDSNNDDTQRLRARIA